VPFNRSESASLEPQSNASFTQGFRQQGTLTLECMEDECFTEMTAECEEDQKGVQTNMVEEDSGLVISAARVRVAVPIGTTAQHGSVITARRSLESSCLLQGPNTARRAPWKESVADTADKRPYFFKICTNPVPRSVTTVSHTGILASVRRSFSCLV
jgi:hypothetical protein